MLLGKFYGQYSNFISNNTVREVAEFFNFVVEIFTLRIYM